MEHLSDSDVRRIVGGVAMAMAAVLPPPLRKAFTDHLQLCGAAYEGAGASQAGAVMHQLARAIREDLDGTHPAAH